jgi:long-chain acyl-CoA synthetase
VTFDYAAHGLRAPERRPEIPGGPQTVAAVLDRVVASDPGREALVGRSGRFTYAELDRAVDRAASALADLGVQPFDRVAATLPNDVDIVIAFLATMRLGAMWVGINRALAPPEKTYMLADAGVRVMIGDADTVAQVAARRAEVPALEHLLELPDWRQRCASAADQRPRIDVDPFAPAAIAYTSGTTGFPKGAVHSQHNLLVPGAIAAALGTYGGDCRQGVVLPLTILNLMVLVPVLAFQDGSCCVAIDRTDAEGLAGWIRDERVGHLAAVPTIYRDLLTHPAVGSDDLRSLRRPEVGGAECPAAVQELYRARFGAEPTIGYGMTEAPTAVTRAHAERASAPGFCGKAVPQVEIIIVDGEVCVAPAKSGPFAGVYTPMLGYWNKPDATAEALRDGVYRSGDLGSLDADGKLFIHGRRNELILRGGANVYPAEVERVLRADPRVADCAVLGIDDERLGQRVAAAVVLAGETASPHVAGALRAHCAAELARYKVPDAIHFIAALPRNSMGKVVKHRLATLFADDQGRAQVPCALPAELKPEGEQR